MSGNCRDQTGTLRVLGSWSLAGLLWVWAVLLEVTHLVAVVAFDLVMSKAVLVTALMQLASSAMSWGTWMVLRDWICFGISGVMSGKSVFKVEVNV